VAAVFEHYGNVPARSYDDQAALTTDLINELNSATHAPRVALLGQGAWLAKLEEVNNAFIATMRDRYEEVAKRPATRMREARVAVDKTFHALVARLEAVITLNGIDFTPELAPFVAEFNAIATRYKNILAIEHGRRAAAASKDENEGNEFPDEDNESSSGVQ
jgi:hypothetical protein